jgi:hypothetical protein
MSMIRKWLRTVSKSAQRLRTRRCDSIPSRVSISTAALYTDSLPRYERALGVPSSEVVHDEGSCNEEKRKGNKR